MSCRFVTAQLFDQGFTFFHIGPFFISRQTKGAVMLIPMVSDFQPSVGNFLHRIRIFFDDLPGNEERGRQMLPVQQSQAPVQTFVRAVLAPGKVRESDGFLPNDGMTQKFRIKIKSQHDGNPFAFRPLDPVPVFQSNQWFHLPCHSIGI